MTTSITTRDIASASTTGQGSQAIITGTPTPGSVVTGIINGAANVPDPNRAATPAEIYHTMKR